MYTTLSNILMYALFLNMFMSIDITTLVLYVIVSDLSTLLTCSLQLILDYVLLPKKWSLAVHQHLPLTFQ